MTGEMRKEKANWKKAWRTGACLAGMAAVSIWLGSQPVWAAEGARVFDDAGLFTGDETTKLETRIDEVRDAQNVDVAVLTVEDAEGKTAEEYADDFYDSHGLGVGEDASGLLLSIDMDNREIYISTSGYALRVLTDARIEKVLDAAYDSVADGQYAEGALEALDSIENYLELGVPEGQYTEEREEWEPSLEWYEVLMSALIAALIAWIPCRSVKRRYQMKKEHNLALESYLAYRANSALHFTRNDEKFINRTVVTRRIPKEPEPSAPDERRTTVHQSSSGKTHGGGGRKF